MAQVITFSAYRPSPRYDDLPWTEARIEEAVSDDGPWTQIDAFTLDPVDANPELPASRSFTTELASDTAALWYRIVFADATGDTLQPTAPVQNLSPSIAATVNAVAYASAAELAGILHIRNPSTDQTAKLERVLSAAAGEINSEIGRTNSDLASWELDLAAQVNLDRAADLWRHTESIPGITGILGDDGGMVLPGRYSWERYAQRLAPLKQEWGLA